jgi:hypothetical protein
MQYHQINQLVQVHQTRVPLHGLQSHEGAGLLRSNHGYLIVGDKLFLLRLKDRTGIKDVYFRESTIQVLCTRPRV